MKVIVQRVTQASCKVEGTVVGAIDNGYLVLVGFTHKDTTKDIQYMAKKIAHLRVFEDENGKLNINIMDKQYSILSISQFTLYGDASKGNRPSFTEAMEPATAEILYKMFNETLEKTYNIPVQTGKFGAYMSISLTNDGPVTITLETTHD
jgi:D-tyrosyl-tRNA(Tyr) deacylase